jgi:hypothetical protein
MFNWGDFAPGQTVHGWYPTQGLSGGSITRATDGTLSVYKDNSDTQTTTGVTSGEDNDSLTGLHRYAVATTDSFYTPGSQFFVVLSGAVIDGQTVNTIVGTFTIGFTGVLRRGPLQSATASTAVLDSAAALGDDNVNGSVLVITGGTGIHQSRVVTDYVTATDTATVSPDWTTTPDSTSTFALFASPPAPTSAAGIPAVNVTHIGGTAATSAAGIPEVKVASIAASAVTAASLAADAGTEIAAAVLAAAAADPIDANVEQVNTVAIIGDGNGTPFNVA